jgi:hemoglobin
MTDNSTKTPYQLMGGKDVLLKLVERFYFLMDTLPEVEGLRKIHAPDLSHAKSKLFKFLSGWLGGPSLFIQEFGHPMLKRRHFPFAIGSSERDQWMICMNRAMDEVVIDSGLKESLLESLNQLATHMINQ